MEFNKGSEWRRWDLHVHTKGTLKEDNFTSDNFQEFCITLFRRALEDGIAAIGITDYFSVEKYKKVCQFVDEIDKIDIFTEQERNQIRRILIIPNVELRMLPATDSGRLINIHCLFNPEFVDSLDNHFFSSLEHSGGNGKKYKMNKKGMIDLGKSTDSSINEVDAFNKGISTFAVSYGDLQKLKDSDKDFRENVIIAVSNSNQDGASGLQKHYQLFEGTKISSLDEVRKAIYTISDCIFSGNPKDADYFSGKGKDDPKTVRLKCGTLKPCIHGSDAHIESKLFKPDQDRYCWIKADPTFNGLRQILYEPLPGERVCISQIKPDQKKDYQIIKKIEFQNTQDFPQNIVFNPNLCSIIGSRSVGKSALLAYLADSVDSEQTREKKEKGPGEGYPWSKVDFEYSIEWANGEVNKNNPGKVVYIPQNFLYEMSGKPEDIKNKILPVLNNKFPQIGKMYAKVDRDLKRINSEISKAVGNWFDEKEKIGEINETLKNLGTIKAVEAEIKKTEAEIKEIKNKYKLKASEVKKLQNLTEKVSTYENRISQIDDEIEIIGVEGEKGEFFEDIEISLSPPVEDLPDALQEKLQQKLDGMSNKIVISANKIVTTYLGEIKNELSENKDKLKTSSEELNVIKKKQEKNEVLESLIEKSSDLKSTRTEIKNNSKKLTEATHRLSETDEEITRLHRQRLELITELKNSINTLDQSNIKDMSFGIEAELENDDILKLEKKINTRDGSDFVSSHNLEFEKIRAKPTNFLESIFTGNQKINRGYEKKEIGIEALILTEKVLFSAYMEGDKIGGFSEPTMTPGKRALFALRLILAESDDKWPLLIDQPEDDLDSRSIYEDIVPFLREKKRERQIIMVSHNANLVIGADSEQIIVANRHGEDRKNEDEVLFNYLSGSIENTKPCDPKCKDTLKSQGIREHACQVLEGGEIAFEHRSNRYAIKRSNYG